MVAPLTADLVASIVEGYQRKATDMKYIEQTEPATEPAVEVATVVVEQEEELVTDRANPDGLTDEETDEALDSL